MKTIPIIWLIFTILFFCFGIYHYIQSKQSFPRFKWETIDAGAFDVYSPSAIETRHNLEKYIKQWNEYIDKQNSLSRRINLIASITYFISSFMAFIAMILPGPYNIKETKEYLYGKCNNFSLIKRFFRLSKLDGK